MKDKILFIIPARGGSKGIPQKNIKQFAGKPLIYYSIDLARNFVDDENICVSTNDKRIIEIVEDYNLRVPFTRPEIYATDTAKTENVLLHAIDFYEKKGKLYDTVILLQPTSPLRNITHIKEALSLYKDEVEMIVSVKESHTASIICKENENGYIELVLNKGGDRRQDIPKYYEYNGAIYIININSMKSKGFSCLVRKKYLMDTRSSIDIDTILDWEIAEYLYTSNREI
jgi:N-acylneuraminate cytidylyltransferase